jgi:hypothetical protein
MLSTYCFIACNLRNEFLLPVSGQPSAKALKRFVLPSALGACAIDVDLRSRTLVKLPPHG